MSRVNMHVTLKHAMEILNNFNKIFEIFVTIMIHNILIKSSRSYRKIKYIQISFGYQQGNELIFSEFELFHQSCTRSKILMSIFLLFSL